MQLCVAGGGGSTVNRKKASRRNSLEGSSTTISTSGMPSKSHLCRSSRPPIPPALQDRRQVFSLCTDGDQRGAVQSLAQAQKPSIAVTF